jgi:SAM-dependent methyltransferase
MKPMALVFIPIVLSLAADIAWGQGFRGFAGGGRAGGWSQSQPAVNQGQQLPQASFTAQSRITSAPPQPIQPQTRAGHTVTIRSGRGTFAAAPAPNTVRIAPVPLATVRHYSHPQRFFRRHPGILIVEVPQFVETTVITSYVPGVVRADRRLVEESSGRTAERGPGQLAPFDPTPQEAVARMLTLARVKSGDVLYDLGSGDGRLVIAAAKKFGAKAVGFEIDPGLVKLARENARKEGVENLVEFRQQDFLNADLSPASVVTLYLSYDGNLAVRPQLMQQLRPGARVVSYTFDMGDWSPKIAESYRDKGGDTHMLYLWEIDGALQMSNAR